MTNDYLSGLNEEQRKAVEVLKGPVMIIAGAGSGKTKVLTSRIAHLIHSGVNAFRIMALTFTNKAAGEIKERVEQALGNTESRNIYAGTFHSVFARILRVEAHHLGYTSNFSIYDVDDSKSILKKAITDLGLDIKAYKVANVYNRISSAKNELISYETYEADDIRRAYDESSRIPNVWKIYKLYAQRCFKNNAMDFDDILLNTYNLFNQFHDVLHKYQNRILHILIDEFQDTNPLQYEIIKRLGRVHENICVVGDDAQSIYSFRGASVQNILQFQNDYKDTQLFKLEQNYRSKKNILHIANELIHHNQFQIEKKLWTAQSEGPKVIVSKFTNDNEEARTIVQTMVELQLRNQIPNTEIAILYRTNAQSRIFEENLRRHNIPYVIYGGFSFYQRKEIKDFVCYLKLVLNPKDDEALKRIINYPTRGIGQLSVNKYSVFAYDNNVPFFDILSNIAHFETKQGHIKIIREFVQMIEYFRAEAAKKDAYELAVIISKQTGIRKELFEDKTPEGLARYQNLEELLNSIKNFIDNDKTNYPKDLSAYLQQVSLVTSGDESNNTNKNSIKLMTIHAAKGLEFEAVFITGLQEGVFPSLYSINSREQLEEERRLFYVAITRAKVHLLISYASSRYIHGSVESCEESRFIRELNDEYIQFNRPRKITNYSSYQRDNQGSSTSSKTFMKNLAKTAALQQSTHPISANFKPTYDFSEYINGAKIEHEKFGFGMIKTIDGSPNNLIATIIFERFGEKKIMLKFAKTQLCKS